MGSFYRCVLAAATVLPLAWAQLDTRSPWPMYAHDAAHSGRSQDAGPAGPELKLLWTYYVGDQVLTVTMDAQKHLLVSTASVILSLNVADGSLFFNWTGDSASVAGAPALSVNGALMVPGGNGKLVALNATTAQIVWKQKCEEILITGSPVIGPDNTVYVATWAGAVWAVNGDTGAAIWTSQLGDQILTSSVALSPDASTAYVPVPNGTVVALNTAPASNGSVIWQRSLVTGLPPFLVTAPALSPDGSVIFVTTQGTLFALRAEDGEVLFTHNSSVLGEANAPVVGGDGTVFFCVGSAVIAVSGVDGTLLWQVQTSAQSDVYGPIIDASGIVYVATDSAIAYALSPKTGAIVWSTPLTAAAGARPILADGVLYVGSDDGTVAAYAQAD